jgi:hypothetical protein
MFSSPNPKQPGSSFIPVLEAVPQSHTLSFKNNKGIQLPDRQKTGFPTNSKEDTSKVEDTTSVASKHRSF